jgi:hypothetical protein
LEKTLKLPTNTLQITALRDFYWPVGTHYYTPLKHTLRGQFIDNAQHPMNGMLVVGEVVAANQGWTEGALESVSKVVTKQWLNA